MLEIFIVVNICANIVVVFEEFFQSDVLISDSGLGKMLEINKKEKYSDIVVGFKGF